MAIIDGTTGNDNLFGTNDDDLIRGLGGRDTIQANSGNDTISGIGTVYGNDGADKYFAVGISSRGWGELPLSNVEMGNGRDKVIMNAHDDWGDPRHPFNLGFNVDMGGGRDKVVFTGNTMTNMHADLGSGKDTAFFMVELGSVWANPVGSYGDGKRDTFHVDGHGSLTIYNFEEVDRLVIHDTDLSFEELKLRTTILSSSSWKITLPNEKVITVGMTYEGGLPEDQIKIVSDPLRIKQNVLIGDDTEMTKVLFGSGADEVFRKKDLPVFMGSGNDKGVGDANADRMYGEAGDDRLVGKRGDDLLVGGNGDDVIIGGGGNDELWTGNGNDIVKGGAGKDHFFIQNGPGEIFGGRHSDTFEFVGGHNDFGGKSLGVEGNGLFVTGGGGRDVYKFGVPEPSGDDGYDAEGDVVITDFNTSKDIIDFAEFRREFEYADPETAKALLAKNMQDIAADENDYGVDGVLINAEGTRIYLEGHSVDDLTTDIFFFG